MHKKISLATIHSIIYLLVIHRESSYPYAWSSSLAASSRYAHSWSRHIILLYTAHSGCKIHDAQGTGRLE